jgi:hypothetical protein
MYIGLHVKCTLILLDFKLEFIRHIFEKFSDIEFNENSCGGSRVGPC